ncbi:MAG: RNA polymerase sigma factor [Candidatus Limnocylindrales bacterium]
MVAELRARRPDAVERLLHDHGAEIQAVAFLILRNERDAEEVVADTLLTAWRRIESLRDPSRLRPWLLRIATRDALHRRSRRPQTLRLDEAGGVEAPGSVGIDGLALSHALNQLPPRMRAVIALHYIADLTTPSVADVLGRSENTVKSELREARRRLRQLLADDDASAVGRRKEAAGE